MLYIGNDKIIKGYIGNTPITHIGMGNSDLIKIEGSGAEYPENTVAVYTVSGTSAVSPYSVSDKASDWLETHIDNGDGTSTMIITASTPPTAIKFQNRTTLLSVEYINTSNITNMYNMFFGCTNLTSLDVSNFDTSNVTTMYGMFYSCTNLTSLDLSNFDTSKVTTMQQMFSSCTNLTSLDVSNFNTSSVTTIYGMFEDCTSLTSIDLSNFNTSKVTNMSYMFSGCSDLTNLDIRRFNMEKLGYSSSGSYYSPKQTYNCTAMFSGCTSLAELRLDNCNNYTLTRIKGLTTSGSYGGTYYWTTNFPTFSSGTHNVYFKQANYSSTTFATGWTINYVD